jgi:preprotein translocase subunit SecF
VVDLFRNRKWDLVSKRGVYYLISGIILLIGIISLFTQGLNLGIDFKGGGLVTYKMAENTHIEAAQHQVIIKDIRDALDAKGIGNEVQIAPSMDNSGDLIIVRTELAEKHGNALSEDIETVITPAVNATLAEHLPDSPAPTIESSDIVSGTVKDEMINSGIAALIIGSVLILFWIWIRYNIGGFGLRYSFAGLLALIHDLLILVGLFALFHNVFQVNSPFIAALLTVLGYSIHDTIVIFDRIRENIRLRKGRTFAETVNTSLLETMARSINTVLTLLFTLLALFFFGGPTLRDFVAAMLIGVVVGGYSSIFIASQLLVSWSKGTEREILPPDALVPAMAGTAPSQKAAAAAPRAAAIASSTADESVESVKPAEGPSREAIQRAKRAGKTARRRR